MKNAVIIAWLATALAKQPGSRVTGETREEYEARVRDIATAFVEEARPFATGSGWTLTELAAAGAVIWHGETLFDKRIHAGEEHPIWNQDHGLARCGMQLHRSGIVPQDVWEKLVGLGKDATRLCAQYGLRVVVAQAKQCGVFIGQRADRGRVAQMLASYASGGKCRPTDRDWARADRWVKIMATRPDHEKKAHPGFRRAAPAEIPQDVKDQAQNVAWEIGVKGFENVKVGAVFLLTNQPKWALVVENHAEGKVGVSVLVKE